MKNEMKRSLVAGLLAMGIPMGLVGTAALAVASTTATHTVTYTVAPLRSISVVAQQPGSENIVFPTIGSTDATGLTDSTLLLRYTAQDAVASASDVNISAKLNSLPSTGITLAVSAGAPSAETTGSGLSSVSLTASDQSVVTGIFKAGGVIDATSLLTYKLTTSSATSVSSEARTVTFTLTD
jgi:hypothetical protein